MVAVIGDVHGCYQTLKQLVENIRTKYPGISIYCVGDLVDRGNYSFEVIEFVLSENILFTLGNHDLMFYSFFKHPASSMANNWTYNGSESTLTSYQDKPEKLEEHLDVLVKSPVFINTDDCFISHAGISQFYKNKLPSNIFENLNELENILRQDLNDKNSILWCRTALLNIGKLQVVGHTHRKDILYDEASNAVYIDTTAFGLNKLSAVIVQDNKVIERIEQKTFRDDSDSRWNYYL